MLATLRTIGKVLITLVVVFFLYVSVIGFIYKATATHWLLGLGLTLGYGAALALGIQDLRRKDSGELPAYKVLGIFILTVLIGATVAASISQLLELVGWATYLPIRRHHLFEFHVFYLWSFLDMLPGLDISKSLGLTGPVQPQGVVAGLPIVAFRAFVIFGLLGSLKVWWKGRTAADKPED
jgi:hypothetical protein